jgi:hypothetical protein
MMDDVSLDPVEVLEAQYRSVGESLGELGYAESGEDRTAWLAEFTREIELAARIEQQLQIAISAADTRLFVEESSAERAVMARLSFHLKWVGDPDSFEFALAALQGLFRSHVARQRRELYLLVGERLTGAAREECAERINATQLGADVARRGRSSLPLARPA